MTLPEGVERCCGGVITVAPEYLTLTQGLGLIYGTTARTLAYGPRVLVETANWTYTKLMGLAKRKFALAFLLAGVNRRIVRAWKAKRAEAPAHSRRLQRYDEALTSVASTSAARDSTRHRPLTSGAAAERNATAPPGRVDAPATRGARSRSSKPRSPLRR